MDRDQVQKVSLVDQEGHSRVMGPVQTCAVILALWLPILLSVATLSDVGIGPNVYTTIFQASLHFRHIESSIVLESKVSG